MRISSMPRVTLKANGQLGEHGWHSIVISLLRGLAALAVAAAHLRADLYPGMRTITDPPLWFKGFAFVTGFAHHAVLVFFVISGWLVGGSLLDKLGKPNAIAGYAIDRVTRLWTVLIPTFVLTLLFALAMGTVTYQGVELTAATDYSAMTFVANLVGLQTILVPAFGGNFPLWSLANETWYYLLFPLLAVTFFGRGATARSVSAVGFVLLCVLLPSALVGYFAVWLLGVAFSRVSIDCGVGQRIGWMLLVAAMWAYYRLTGNMDAFDLGNLVPDLVCSLAFLVLLSSLRFPPAATTRLSSPVAKVGTFLAEFSFSLYVLHVPMIGVLKHWVLSPLGLRQLSPHEPLHFVLYLGLLGVLVFSAYGSYLMFESRTYKIRNLLKRTFLEGNVQTAAKAAIRTD